MRIINCIQRSDEWYLARHSVITASNADRLLTPAKRKTYALELIAEQKSDYIPESFTNSAMQWGIDNEEIALAWYEFETGNKTEKVGFCIHDNHELLGCSPDSLVEPDGLLEIKCPSSKNHVEYMVEGIPKDYFYQVQLQMLVTGRMWCDFVSYDPRMCFDCRGYIQRINACEKTQDDLLNGYLEVIKLIDEYKLKIVSY